jgi:Tfp pilus assembly protein PilF
MKREDNEKALTLLRKAIQLGGDNRLAYLDIAAILVDQKQYPEALSALRGAEKLDPNQSDVHFRIGRLYQIMGDSSAAEKEFRKVRELKQKEEEDLAPKATKNPSPE